MSQSAESQRRIAQYYKSLKRCVRCHKQDAYTLNGRSYCFECAEQSRRYSKEKYQKVKEKQVDWKKKLREERLSKGLCYICGRPQDKAGRKCCELCAAKDRIRYQSHRKPGTLSHQEALDRVNDSLCYRCGNPIKQGLTADLKPYKVCERCWQDNVKAAQKGKEAMERKYDMSGFALVGHPIEIG